jgi:hypothetical protein
MFSRLGMHWGRPGIPGMPGASLPSPLPAASGSIPGSYGGLASLPGARSIEPCLARRASIPFAG